MSTTTRWRAVLFPVGRIVLATLLVGGAVYAAELAVKALEGALSLGGAAPALYYLAYLLVGVLVAFFVYRAYVRLVEKRALTELSGTGAPKELGAGMLVGFALVAAIIGVLWLLGYYRVAGAGVWTAIFAVLANDGAGAFVEEVLFRGVLFRISEEKLGTWIALAISASLFALLHLTSPHATATSVVVVGLEGGVLPSAAYVLTRRLWLAIGIHFAWDFSQNYVFGLTGGGLLRGDLSGPALLSGGSNGLEGSILALGLCLAVSASLLAKATQKGNLMRPFWRRAPLLADSARGVRSGSVAP
jgi:membrane protease YdiL (CAAX protease family)